MARVNPPPNLKVPRDFLKEKDKRKYFEQLEFIIFQLWARTGGGEDIIETVTGDAIINQGDTGRVAAQLSRLDKRLESVESRDIDGINAKIARLNRRVDALLETLITEIRALNNVEFESKLLSFQSIIVNELELFNLRSEEAWETDLDRGDTQ